MLALLLGTGLLAAVFLMGDSGSDEDSDNAPETDPETDTATQAGTLPVILADGATDPTTSVPPVPSEGDLTATAGEVLPLQETLLASSTQPGATAPPYDGTITTPDAATVRDTLEARFGVPLDTRADYEALLASLSIGPDDSLVGTPSADKVFAGEGDDMVTGWEGNDRVFLQDGADTYAPLFANEDAGDDFVRGGGGNDWLISRVGADTLMGDSGNDLVTARDTPGEATPDVVSGGWGDDQIEGDSGDTLSGGQGHDVFAVYLPQGNAAPAVITDFTPADDSLDIYVETDTPRLSEDYTVTLQEANGATQVSVDGRVAVELTGITGLSADAIRVGNYRTV